MQSRFLLALGVLTLAVGLSDPALAQIEGRTPKGIKYRMEYRQNVTEVAVAYMFRDPALGTVNFTKIQNYGHPAMFLGSDGEERDTVLRKIREAQITSSTLVPLRGYLGGTLVMPTDKLALAATTLASVFQKPDYAADEMEEFHNKVMKGWRDKNAKDPLLQVQSVAADLLLADYPYRRWAMVPSVADIKPPSTASLEAWHKATIGRNNLLVAVAGNVREGDAAAFIDRVFGGLPEISVPAEPVEPKLRPVRATIRIEKDATQVYARAYVLVPRFNEDLEKAVALAVAVRAFGVGPDSLLYKAIRGEMAAAYSTSSGMVPLGPNSGVVVTTLQLDPEKAPAALERLRSEYERLISKGIEVAQVKAVTAELKKEELNRPPLSRASNMLQYEGRNISTTRVREAIRLYDQIRADRINELIREILPQELFVVVLAPKSVKIAADCTIKDVKEADKCRPAP